MYFDPAGGTAQQAATAVATFWGALDAFFTDDLTWLTESEVSEINPNTGALEGVVNVTSATAVGVNSAELLPNQNQLLIRWRTGEIGNKREIRGRTFVPGMTEGNSDGGIPASGIAAGALAAGDALIASANAQLVVWHRPTTPGGSDGEMADVISCSVWNKFAALRTRRD
jgi:hypothetical protein